MVDSPTREKKVGKLLGYCFNVEVDETDWILLLQRFKNKVTFCLWPHFGYQERSGAYTWSNLHPVQVIPPSLDQSLKQSYITCSHWPVSLMSSFFYFVICDITWETPNLNIIYKKRCPTVTHCQKKAPNPQLHTKNVTTPKLSILNF